MKFLITADIHLTRYGQDKIEESSNLPERLHSLKSVLDEMAEYCYNNDIETMIIAGDLLDSKSIIYAISQKLMLEFFRKNPDIKFWVLDGNHDLSGKGVDSVSALESLDSLENVKWITKEPVEYENFVCIPYSYNVVDQVKNSSNDILISHFGLNEGVLNSGISIVADLSLRDLIGKYKLVLLGHYHKPQEILRDDINLYYVGSPIQLNWGEKGDNKRFLIVDTETLDVQNIPLTSYRKHIELGLTSTNKDEVLKLANEAKEAGDYVKIIQKETVDIDDLKGDFFIVDKRETDITNRGITSSMSIEDKLKKYLEIREIPQAEYDEYIKCGIEIIESCEGES